MRRDVDFLYNSLHIFVLWNFAVCQPLFAVLAQHAEFFIARHSEPTSIFLLVLTLCVLPPVLLTVVEGLLGLFGRVIRKAGHWVVISALLAMNLLPVLKRIDSLTGETVVLTAAILGLALALAYIRFQPLRTFVTVLTPAPVLFAGLFLFNSPVFNVAFPRFLAPSARSSFETTPPIVMVIFDELATTSLMDERRMIDETLYPNFAALASDATWFRNATTVSDHTHVAVPAILSGRYPGQARLPTAQDYPRTLFTLLGERYKLRVFESMTALCPPALCADTMESEPFLKRFTLLLEDVAIAYLHIVFPTDSLRTVPTIDQTWFDFRQRAAPGRDRALAPVAQDQSREELNAGFEGRRTLRVGHFNAFLNSIQASDDPTLYFLHVLLPHVPYQYLPSGKTYGVSSGLDGLKSQTWGGDERATTRAYQRYLLQVGFVDTLLGRLIQRLKTLRLYDSCVLVITSDHGVSFLPNDKRRAITQGNYHDIMPVPLFIKVPGQRSGVISDRNIETIDILPTISAILGVDLQWPLDGQPAFAAATSERRRKVVYTGSKAARSFSYDSALPAKFITLDRKCSLFHCSGGLEALYRVGPYRHLIGTSITRTPVTGKAPFTIQLNHAALYSKVDPESPLLPNHITGSVLSKEPSLFSIDLAIAVNGIIRAVTTSFVANEQALRFSAMVPEESFRTGRNEVDVFQIEDSTNGIRLRRAQSAETETYRLARVNGTDTEIIIAPDGSELRVTREDVKGHIGKAATEGDFVEFRGWAADVGNSEPVAAVVVFINGDFFVSGPTDKDRPDVARAFKKPAIRRAGFTYSIPLQLLSGGIAEVRFFALSNSGGVSELRYFPGYPWLKSSKNAKELGPSID